jgi:hypothetical protein
MPNVDADCDYTIWRYMDIVKLVDLFKTESLYFRRVDRFKDPFEGALGLRERKEFQEDVSQLVYILNQPKATKRGADGKLRPKIVTEAQKHSAAEMAKNQLERTQSFANCWCATPHESDAMWNLFCADISSGIALQSTFLSLRDALRQNRSDIRVEKVAYIDFRKKDPAPGKIIFTKRIAFQHEEEVRAAFRDPDTLDHGMRIPINIGSFVKSIVISPLAEAHFGDVVQDLVSRFGFDIPVRQSEMIGEVF